MNGRKWILTDSGVALDDVSNINPTKPLWPVRPDDKNPGQNKRDDEDAENKQKQPQVEEEEPRKDDNDGHIDEYV